MAKQFIKIQQKRYRLSSVKRYEPFENEHHENPFGLYVYFSMVGESGRIYHTWELKKDRDDVIEQLDAQYGV